MDEKQANQLIEEFVLAGVGLARELGDQEINHTVTLADRETNKEQSWHVIVMRLHVEADHD